ncbi:hypothetical protein AVEN_233015-1 [Araneus ventricosus]|uniref:Uncharacterized protein n=1 Tax=Araneus ventricosus TaxID=182803 RepID=A0A4Y2W540_ARAVE|nr:hypothetical protein AVEN_233015-1 [Araneus ventricosus]
MAQSPRPARLAAIVTRLQISRSAARKVRKHVLNLPLLLKIDSKHGGDLGVPFETRRVSKWLDLFVGERGR